MEWGCGEGICGAQRPCKVMRWAVLDYIVKMGKLIKCSDDGFIVIDTSYINFIVELLFILTVSYLPL